MIGVSMADENDLRVAIFEAKLLNTRFDCWNVLLEVCVDEDVPLRSVDQISRQIGGAHIIKISGDLKRGKSAVVVRIALRQSRRREGKKRKEYTPRHIKPSAGDGFRRPAYLYITSYH